MQIIFSIVFAALTVLAVSLQKTYQAIPLRELKHRARDGDALAALLHRAVSYGYSLRAVLGVAIAVFAALFFLSITQAVPAWFAFVLSVCLLWLSFFWIPNSSVSTIGVRVAGFVAPALARLLGYVHPVIDWVIQYTRKFRPVHIHTGMYDTFDLLQLLERQEMQTDSRIERSELQIAQRALTFGRKQVRDIMTPRRVVHTVSAEDSVGPVLLSELHKTGWSRFPVYDALTDAVVGTVYLRDLMQAKAGGRIADVMRSNDICYLHEDQPLTEALQAVLKTRRHLMIVINSFEEYVGIVTIEDVLEQVIGHQIVDEFDQYDDMRAVAAKAAAKSHKAHTDHTRPDQ